MPRFKNPTAQNPSHFQISATQTDPESAWIDRLREYSTKRAAALAESEFTPYPTPPHERIAPLSRHTIEGNRLAERGRGSYRPYLERGQQVLQESQTGFPEHAERYMNPYMRHVVNRIGEEGERTFKERIMPHLSAQFAGLGQHGSTRHAQMAERAARDLQNEIMAKQQQAMATGYQQAGQIFNADQARSLEAARQHTALGSLEQAGNEADVVAALRMGELERARDQAVLDEEQRQFTEQREYPHERLAQLAAYLNQIPLPTGSRTTQIQQQRGAAQPGGLMAAGNTASNLLALTQLMAGHARGGYIRRRY